MKKNYEKSVKILGAGVSGLSAAIILARNGIETEVFEKQPHIGGRFIRDFQGLQNYGYFKGDQIQEFEKMGIRIKPYMHLKRAIRFSPSLFNFEVVTKKIPIFYLVVRGKDVNSLDSQLAETAINLGVKIHHNSKINKNATDIIATGPHKATILAYDFYYNDINMEDAAYMFLGSHYSPGKYLFAIPGEEKGEAVIVTSCGIDQGITYTRLKKLLQKAIDEIPTLKDIVDGSNPAREFKHLGCLDIPNSAYRDGKYFVGEAGGFQDAIAYFGIRYAINTGYLAAQSIITGKNYDTLWKESLKPSLELEAKRAWKYEKMMDKDLDNMFQFIIKKYGPELSLEEYLSIRGKI